MRFIFRRWRLDFVAALFVCFAGCSHHAHLVLGAAPMLGGGEVELLSAYYMPDPEPPQNSNQVEGDLKPRQNGVMFKPLKTLYENYDEFGGARVVLRNNTNLPVKIDRAIWLNGAPIEDHYVDFLDSEWDERGVTWYRVRPEVLQPGKCGQIYIRFRRRPEGKRATVTVNFDHGQEITATIPLRDPGIKVDFVTADRAGDTLYVYARRSDKTHVGHLTGLTIDGRPVKDFKVYGKHFPGNVALAVAKLPEPMTIGDFHVVGVQTCRGHNVAAQFRVLPFFYMRTAWNWGPNSPQETQELGMNTMFKSGGMSAERAKHLGVYLASGGHERQRYEYLSDEPDAKDRHPQWFQKYGKEWFQKYGKEFKDDPGMSGTGYAVGLGMSARRMINSGVFERLERDHPHVASYLITNGTTRPLNWAVYGQLSDIACTDPYPVNFYGSDFPTIREQYRLMQLNGAPKPFHACLETYKEPHNPSFPRRAPIAAEFRQNYVQAIGCGAKGTTSWVWNTGGGFQGADRLPGLRDEYIRMNKITEHLEDDLLLGTPIDIVSNDSGLTETGSWYFLDGEYKVPEPWMKERVWTGALLCGPDTIVIAAANHIPAQREAPETIEPARDVTIKVKLPKYLRDVDAFEATGDGESLYPIKLRGRKAIIHLSQIESGRLFVLRRK